MKEIEKKDIEFKIVIHPEDLQIRGNAIASGDENYDKKIEQFIIDDLESGNLWAWCCVEVIGHYKEVLTASCFLGGCSYKNEDDFKVCDYFECMKDEIVNQLNSQIKILEGESI